MSPAATRTFIQRTQAVALALALTASHAGHAALATEAHAGDSGPTTATRHVHGFADGQGMCDSDSVKEAVSLVYQADDLPAAANIAQRCDAMASALGRPFYKIIASRVHALIAMRVRDMAALKNAGESLVAEAQVPEYVADGHMFIAFACVFGGNPKCAREHVEQARTMFTELKVTDALAQLQPLEQALVQLEEQGGGR
ncbi:MAG: hypothetical protein QM749_12275 [Aquabacterium sp.]